MERYLDLALEDYEKADIYPFHMPGHKRQKLGNGTPEEIDITEIEGFDNLHHARGIIREAQERLAGLAGADHSFWLVNGSTSGLLAAISACTRRGGRILMGRNSHRAVYDAAILMELRTEYLYPQETGFGIAGSVDPEQVARMLKRFPDTQAVVLTSPTYDGVVSDIRTIAGIVHGYGIPLIVDEAHGAHFGFADAFPPKALTLGADLCVESLHKTLPAYTQSAVLHVADSGRVDIGRVRRYLGIYQTSSPSYVLMAGMDRCARILAERGEALFAAYTGRLREFYRACGSLKNIRVFPCENTDAGIWDRDISKILICAEGAGLNGQQLYELLLTRYRLQLEMAAGHYATALTSVMDTQEGFDRLLAALREIDGGVGGSGKSCGVIAGSDSGKENCCGTAGSSDREKDAGARLTAREIYLPPVQKMRLFEAADAPKREVGLTDAAGCIAGEFIFLYPPGIPIAAPGEEITPQILCVLETCRRRGMPVQGMQDPDGEKLLVVRGRAGDFSPELA